MNRIKKIPRQAIDYMIGVALMSPAIITFLGSTFDASVTFSSILVLSVLLLLMILFGFSEPKIKLPPIALAICGFLLLAFVISKVIFPDTQYNMLQLGFYILLPILIVQQEFNFERVLKTIILLSIPLVFSVEKILAVENVGLNQADMYATYSFVSPIVASFTYLIFFRDKSKKIIEALKKNYLAIIGFLLNLYYCIRVAQTAVRGYWLILVVYIAMLAILFMQKKLKKKTYYIVLSCSTFIIILTIINLENIVSFLTRDIDANETNNVGFLLKMKRLLTMGDLLNGREKIWGESMQYISQSPIFGNGTESMNRLSNGLYPHPHNFALQLLQDLGILALGFIFITGYLIYKFLKYGYDRSKIILLFLITITVPMVMLSGDIWKNVAFWLMVGYGIKIVWTKKYGKSES